ncbi:uncharacterized protein LOC119955395 isoform X3 [Scyliorhinus canicula]|uniref:uncharacterized protein LOC119955395 isoform X3 n=1 Tax=Scyliorhinus canicula TaxID=7830 RepID=UPI0018F5F3A0|nr:uncharacterized protein LOC119955395 isoform X3 [Scyliorhinus canicula]
MPNVGTHSWMCLLMILWPPASASQKTECIKLNPCKCIMEDGSGVINLAAMGGADGFLERDKPVIASGRESDPDILYSFSPCLPFSEPVEFASECLNVAVCLVIRHQTQGGEVVDFLNFGMHEDNEFSYDNNSQTLTVIYPGLCALDPVRTPNGIEIIPKENIWCSMCYACAERKRRKQRKYLQYK